jgi:hypothetical protein
MYVYIKTCINFVCIFFFFFFVYISNCGFNVSDDFRAPTYIVNASMMSVCYIYSCYLQLYKCCTYIYIQFVVERTIRSSYLRSLAVVLMNTFSFSFWIFLVFLVFLCWLFFIYFNKTDCLNCYNIPLFRLGCFCNVSVCLIPAIAISNISLFSPSFSWEYEIMWYFSQFWSPL